MEEKIKALENRVKELEFFLAEFIEGEENDPDYVRWAVKLMRNPLTHPPRIPEE